MEHNLQESKQMGEKRNADNGVHSIAESGNHQDTGRTNLS